MWRYSDEDVRQMYADRLQEAAQYVAEQKAKGEGLTPYGHDDLLRLLKRAKAEMIERNFLDDIAL